MSRPKISHVHDPENQEESTDQTPDWVLEEQARREYVREYWRNPRIRRCPGCEDAVMDEKDPRAECVLHGDPYEEPFEFELRFHDLFGHSPWEDPRERNSLQKRGIDATPQRN